LSDNEDSLVNLRFQKKMQQLENPQSIRFLKREVAQIKTVLKEMMTMEIVFMKLL
jgi:large subunit ribosomal protein L29